MRLRTILALAVVAVLAGSVAAGGDSFSKLAYSLFQDEGSSLPQRGAVNCVGSGITCSDDPTHRRTVVTVPGGMTATGDIALSGPSVVVGGLQGRPVSNASPTTGEGLVWDGSAWSPGSVGVPMWPGTASIPGSKAHASLAAPTTETSPDKCPYSSGYTVLDVQMPGGSGLHRVLYTNANGDYAANNGGSPPPGAPVGVQIDKQPQDQINNCGRPVHVTGGGGGYITISLTALNVNGGAFVIPSAQPLTVNLEGGGTGKSSRFFGAGVGIAASVQMNFGGSPIDGEVFSIETPDAPGVVVHFYWNLGGTFSVPSTGTWVNFIPPLLDQLRAAGLPVDWTETITAGFPTSTVEVVATALSTGTAYNGGTIATSYAMATLNGGASPGAFVGGTADVPAVPAAPYPVGTATKIAKADGTTVNVVDGVVPEAAHAATATSATTATTAGYATSAGNASTASSAAAINHVLTLAEGGTNSMTAHDARSALGIPDPSQKLTGCLTGAVTPGVTQYLTPSGALSLVPVPLIVIDGTGVKIDNLKTTLASAPGTGAGPRTQVTTIVVSTDLGASWADTSITCTASGTDQQPSDNAHSYSTSSAPVLVALKSVANDDGGNSAAYVAATFRVTNVLP